MKDSSNEFEQLGKFVYRFQSIERQIDGVIDLLVGGDSGMTDILVAAMGFSQKIKCVDIIFARFSEIHSVEGEERKNFSSLMNRVVALSERRNVLVHSKYWSYLASDDQLGLLRKKPKLNRKSGRLEDIEEVLMPEDFLSDFDRMNRIAMDIEQYRIKIIDWLYPEPC